MINSKYIICDTNVWYNMAENHKLFNAVIDNRLQLVPTGIVLKELITHPRTVEGKNKYVFTCLRRFMKNARVHMPFVHLYRESLSLGPEIADLNMTNLVTEMLSKGTHLNRKEYIKAKFKDDFNSFIGITENMNIGLKEAREKQSSEQVQFDNFYVQKLHSIKDLLEGMINEGNKINSFKIDEDLLEPFLKTFLYFDWTKITENPKSSSLYKPNDFNDLFNVSYLRRGELFWTFESNKKQNFKKAMIDVGLEDYLFDKNEEWNKYLNK